MPDGREGRSSLERMPHGYTNLTTRDGSVVSKSYQGPDAVGRCAREAAVLRALSGRLPVPPVIDCGDGTLSMGFMTGVHGQDLIDRAA
jgi:Phosphotransferase enzyme family